MKRTASELFTMLGICTGFMIIAVLVVRGIIGFMNDWGLA